MTHGSLRMLDLFCGRFGWGKVFAQRGWEVVGVDLVEPPEVPRGCVFEAHDVLNIFNWPSGGGGFCVTDGDGNYWPLGKCDFICASSPCEQFSVHGMKHFHPNPPYPELGIRLFNHTRELCEASGVPYVMENVRAAQQFVGNAVHHCGPFYLWGNGVPPILSQGIVKGTGAVCRKLPQKQYEQLRSGDRETLLKARREFLAPLYPRGSASRRTSAARAATIPPELASCVATYAERLLEQTRSVCLSQG